MSSDCTLAVPSPFDSNKSPPLQAQGTSVTLGQAASFYWQLLTEEGYQVANGNLGISGEQYAAWGADDDYVYDIIAEDLNLVIVGDWVDSED